MDKKNNLLTWQYLQCRNYFGKHNCYKNFQLAPEDPVLIEKIRGKVVVEIGCGYGRETHYLAKYAKKVYAIDVSPEVLALAKTTLNRKKVSNKVTLVLAENYKEIIKEPVDYVYSRYVFQHIVPFLAKDYLNFFNTKLTKDGEIDIQLRVGDKKGFPVKGEPIVEYQLSEIKELFKDYHIITFKTKSGISGKSNYTIGYLQGKVIQNINQSNVKIDEIKKPEFVINNNFKLYSPIFISYYTRNTPYEEIMNTRLLPSLKTMNLQYDIQEIPDLQNWNANTAYKSKFIHEMLLKHKKEVVFCDADATIVKYPELLFKIPMEYDVAAHKFNWYLHWRKQAGNPKRELLSGTMLFRYNDKVLNLVKNYIQACEDNPGIWEQKTLQKLIQEDSNIKLYDLPAEYCAVVLQNNELPDYIKDPKIIHWQASRQHKRRK